MAGEVMKCMKRGSRLHLVATATSDVPWNVGTSDGRQVKISANSKTRKKIDEGLGPAGALMSSLPEYLMV